MSLAPTVSVAAQTVEVPGARLYYEVRGEGPLVVLIGSPMDADAFAALADLLAADHTVLTTDPRGINRSRVDHPDQESTPELRAEDLSTLLTQLNAGTAAVFGSSGGAVTALALVQAHPEQVHTIIAHEPPLEDLLDDRLERRIATDDIISTYVNEGPGAAWIKFLAEANIQMPEGDETFQPLEPAERDPQEVADERHFFLHELRATTFWKPDIAALRSAPVRIMVGIGEQSTGQVCDLTSTELAAQLGVEPTVFPGDHTGFVGDTNDFAVALRELLR